MRERVTILGRELEIVSAPGRGTRVSSIKARDLPVGSLREAWSEGRSFAATLPALWVRSCGCYENIRQLGVGGDRPILS